MLFGLSLSTYTTVHVVISLIAILAGLVVVAGMVRDRRLDGWTALFLWTTVLTSVTGFGFPFERILPSHYVGFISLAVLAIAILARYSFHVAGAWRWIYVLSSVTALALNVFVLIVQLFQKLSFLQPLAPTQSELPFVIAQMLALAAFVYLAYLSIRRFHPGGAAITARPGISG